MKFLKLLAKGKRSVIITKLNNPSTSAKTYWSILKTFYSGKKVPPIPPLQIGNTLVSDFKMKANIFNKFFASQCVPLNNDSNIPCCQSICLMLRFFQLSLKIRILM